MQERADTTKGRTTFDGLGRPVKAETLRVTDDTVKTVVDTEYDAFGCPPMGKTKRVSVPYVPGGTVWNCKFDF